MTAVLNADLELALARFAAAVAAPAEWAAGASADKEVRLFVYYGGDPERLSDSPLRVGHFDGVVATGWARLSAIASLAEFPDVTQINLAPPIGFHIDRSMRDCGADSLRSKSPPYTSTSGARAYTGRGVLVGVIDDSVWVRHPSFLKPGGPVQLRKTRFVSIWDQGSIEPNAPHPPGFRYGKYWDEQAINTVLANRGEIQLASTFDHGSHVTGIAAANGSSADGKVPAFTLVGVAPEADLAFCNGARFDGSGAAAADAVRMIFSIAEQRRQPCVINMSFGTHEGARDGTSDLELAIERALTRSDGRPWPGRAVVVAAGNEGDSHRHARKLILGKSRLSFSFKVEDQVFPNGIKTHPKEAGDSILNVDRLYLWYDAPASLAIRLIPPSGTPDPAEWVAEGEVKVSPRVGISAVASTSMAGKKYVCITLWAPVAYGNWRLECMETAGYDTPVDIWVENLNEMSTSPRFSDADAVIANTITCPATSLPAIAVGNCITNPADWEKFGDLIGHSSRGLDATYKLNRAGVRPHLVAPGRRIVSCNNSTYADEVKGVEVLGKRYGAAPVYHAMMTGTSQAAPHVTGLIALMFEKNPQLTAPDVRDILTRTADRSNIPIRGFPNMHWGNGRLDARAAMAAVP